MKVIVTRPRPDGTYDKVGMNNRRLFSHYKTQRGALRYACSGWKGQLRFEFFHDAGFLNSQTQPYETLYVDRR